MITYDDIIQRYPDLLHIEDNEELIVFAYMAGRLDAQKEEIERLNRKIIEGQKNDD